MNTGNQLLGIVQNGQFQLLPPSAGGSPRFTSIAPQEARSPESGELQLAAYEGRAIMMEGMDQGGWVYSASVVDQAGPILTEVVRHVFGQTSSSTQQA